MSQIGFILMTIFMFLGIYHGLINYHWHFKSEFLEGLVNYVILDIRFISIMFFFGMFLVCMG